MAVPSDIIYLRQPSEKNMAQYVQPLKHVLGKYKTKEVENTIITLGLCTE
jgi:hypothetical protein